MKPTHFVLLVLVVALCVSQTDAQWTQIGLSRGISEIAVGSSGLFAVTTDSGCVFRTTDGGTNWVQVVDFGGQHIAVGPNGTVFLSRRDSLFRSADAGDSWTWSGIPADTIVAWCGSCAWWSINCVAVAPGGNVFCGRCANYNDGFGVGHRDSLAISTDNGLSWTNPGILAGSSISFGAGLAVSWGYWDFFGMCYDAGERILSVSRDGGLTWRKRGVEPLILRLIVSCSNRNLMAQVVDWVGTGISADTGATWSLVSTLLPEALLALPRGGVLVGTDKNGIYLFTDNGDSLGPVNQGLTNLHNHAFALDSSGNVYTGTNAGIWQRPVSQIVSVKEPLTSIPASFTLQQNYPNPFNPSTTIKYELPKSSMVRLSVYDMLGREVVVLVNERRDAGSYEVKFDAAGLASGVYIYRLTAGDFVSSKSLIVLK